MFEEDEDVENVAANEDVQEQHEEQQSTSPVDETEKENVVDQTKAFAKRLKEETEKVRLKEREDIAKSFGYESWEEYKNAQTNNTLIDKGLDPETVRPVLKDLIYSDPEYLEAMKYKAEKEELEKELFAKNSIQELNRVFGTNYKNVNELDEETVKMWNNGVPLEKAFAANNWSKLQDMAVKKASAVKDNGKSHLTNVSGSNEQAKSVEITKDQIAVAKAFGFSEEQLRKHMEKNN